MDVTGAVGWVRKTRTLRRRQRGEQRRWGWSTRGGEQWTALLVRDEQDTGAATRASGVVVCRLHQVSCRKCA